jgi:hypothetical protein
MFWTIRHHDETRATAAISKNMARRGGEGLWYISDVVQWPQSMRQQQTETARNWQRKEQNEGPAASIDDVSPPAIVLGHDAPRRSQR